MTHEELLSVLSEDYYLNKLSFGDISKKYNISRYLINKYLNDAVKNGIVKIEISTITKRNPQLETMLADKFKDIHFYIIRDGENDITTSKELSQSAATIAEKMFKNNCKIVGTSWGEAIYSLVDSLHGFPLESVKFTQFMGENMKYNSTAGSMRMVEKIAAKFSSEFLTLPAPLYIVNNQIRQGLYAEPSIAHTLAVAKKMDVLLTGLGTIRSLQSIPIWKENLSKIFPYLDMSRVAGLIYGRPFDINGNILNINNDKVLGISLEEVLATPRRFCLVRSKSKTQAILGVLRGKLITDIILSETLAYRVLAELNL
ncbi:sugar-binding transcriptional regulator [Liquorilactobacillus cacaonum]|uniref:sugar-binding transcriptional regulator n=1 Tax=Liquorilactobacillus cacaonum TaxID=483012 RepID=UPI00070998E0|nr:sugar-binding domain-containing protein [Liquorilactobacillus cacaonum]